MFSREGIYKGQSPLFVHGGYTRGVSPCSYEGFLYLDRIQLSVVANQE
jgi:hypothetical protein